mmetsp:Transcript_6824/g.20139  ORF Transcript_6824/g.20139 Transcript_6824/m.20139 type:complete len:418 (+) Transcript_6824:64-1317(+)
MLLIWLALGACSGACLAAQARRGAQPVQLPGRQRQSQAASVGASAAEGREGGGGRRTGTRPAGEAAANCTRLRDQLLTGCAQGSDASQCELHLDALRACQQQAALEERAARQILVDIPREKASKRKPATMAASRGARAGTRRKRVYFSMGVPAGEDNLINFTNSANSRILATNVSCFLRDRLRPALIAGVRNFNGAKDVLARLGTSTCAVVGSSGTLLQRHQGAQIDSAGAVIRFNDATVRGFEEHVGRREDIRIAPRISNKTLFDKDATYVVWEKGADLEELLETHPESRVLIIDRAALRLAYKIFRTFFRGCKPKSTKGLSKKVSTGAVGVLFAMTYCSRVETFGLTPSNLTANSPYHYYDNMSFNNHWTMGPEHALWELLSETGPGAVAETGVAALPGLGAPAVQRLECSGSLG